MSDPAILVLGSVNVDLVIRGENLPALGETVIGGDFFQAAGGKGANQAVAASRLTGNPVVFIAAVGDDAFGSQVLQGFHSENMVTDYIRVISGRPTGVALIMVDSAGENCISVASGANLCLSANDVEQVPEAVFSSAKVFLTNLESPLEVVARALARAKAHHLTTILNPAPASQRIFDVSILEHVDILTPNETEAHDLTGVKVSDAATAVRAAKTLRQQGFPAVIVTLGAAGSVVVSEEAKRIDATVVRAIDTTAAGDAYNGALAAALSEGLSLEDAARWASRAAAISVTRSGAQPSLVFRSEMELC